MMTTIPKPRALVGSPAAGPGAGRNPGPLVSAAWVTEHLRDQDLRIVHVAPNRRVYNKRHLPGAIRSDLHAELALRGTAPETGDAEREWLVPTRDQVLNVLRKWRVGTDDRLVLYDDVGLNRQAIRGYWLLRMYGFPRDRIHIMDGGIEAWRRAGFETTTEVPEPNLADGRRPPVELGERDDSFLATYEEVLDWSREASNPDGPTRILDVRTAGEYVGTDLRARRGGHIPGARQRCFVDLLTDEGTFRPVDEMLALIRASGVELDEVRATYCQGGAGHCPGGVCLQIREGQGAGKDLFVGDTLFAGSIGRTDLPGGDYATLIASIRTVLFAFGDDARVYPGHGPATTIGEERRTNPFLKSEG